MSTVLIVGASRGIGRELAGQYAADGARVIATHRKPDDAQVLRDLGARPLQLDVDNPESVAALGWHLDKERIDIALIVAGVYGPRTSDLTPPSETEFDAVMRTNVLAPMRLIPILSQSLAAARGRLAVLSSKMGSIGLTTTTSGWLYRASKAALNSVLKSASLELGAQGVVCVAFHPGWVRTDMGGSGADLDVRDSAASLRKVLAAINASHNGRFLNYDGVQLEW
jgi:NAD(P)-dependent dehydrogenase (short-subunit alcohol dehydrogenase family)